jgi:dTDP-4-dehydrorhamnose reductase
MPRILLTGKNGQLGRELQRSLAVVGDVAAFGRQEADLTDLSTLETVVRRTAPDIIVNAAAFTAVDDAEKKRESAYRVNAEAVEVLARVAAEQGSWLVHYSTDYVFDGSSIRPYRESDPVAPQNIYGASKLAGEEAVRRSGCRHLLLRTSWLYGFGGGSFMRAILKRAMERESIEVVVDQTGAPTGADLVAEVTAHCLHRVLSDRALADSAGGTYHLAAAGRATRHEFARFLVDEAIKMGARLKTTPERVLPIPGSAYVTAAKRPANSLLDTAKLTAAFGVALPDWRSGVRKRLPSLLNPPSTILQSR